MSSSDIGPNLVHFLSDTPSGQSPLVGSQLYRVGDFLTADTTIGENHWNVYLFEVQA